MRTPPSPGKGLVVNLMVNLMVNRSVGCMVQGTDSYVLERFKREIAAAFEAISFGRVFMIYVRAP